MDKKYLSTEEAAARLNISTSTLLKLLKRKLILGAIRLGKGARAHWMIPEPVTRIRAARGPRTRPGIPEHMLKQHLDRLDRARAGDNQGPHHGRSEDRAVAKGRTGGRPPALSPDKVEAVTDFLENGGSVSAAARTFGVSRSVIRAVRDGTYPGVIVHEL